MENDCKILADYMWERSSTLVLRFDRQGAVTSANHYARRLLGENCVGLHLGELLVGFIHQLDIDQLLLESGVPRMFNFSAADGMPETLLVTCFRSEDGGILIGENDLAELHEFRSSVLDLNQKLGNLTRELQKKNAELQRLNDLKNQFLGIAAHDLRNPISTIIQYTDFYLDNADNIPSELLEVLADIHSLADFMLHMIVQLLDISVIEMGKLTLDIQMLEIAPFVTEVVKLNRLLANRKNISLEQRFSGGLDRISCDRHKVKQVINNLISNAVKFSTSGSIVTVTICDRNDELRVEVRDQGPGIPIEEQERLFKPFGRSSVKSTGGEQCTGLGLVICRKIVEAHGGRIGMESVPGSGSMFWFIIPGSYKHD